MWFCGRRLILQVYSGPYLHEETTPQSSLSQAHFYPGGVLSVIVTALTTALSAVSHLVHQNAGGRDDLVYSSYLHTLRHLCFPFYPSHITSAVKTS